MKHRCGRCQSPNYDHLPAEKLVFLWKGSYPVKIMVPLTLARCSQCQDLMRLSQENQAIERAIERSVPLYFLAITKKLLHSLSIAELSRKVKIPQRELHCLVTGEVGPNVEHFAKLMKFAKGYEKKTRIVIT